VLGLVPALVEVLVEAPAEETNILVLVWGNDVIKQRCMEHRSSLAGVPWLNVLKVFI
jgi:hypothetical protein